MNGPVTSRPSKPRRATDGFCNTPPELPREPFPVRKLVMSAKWANRTRLRLASCPTVGRAFERLLDAGAR